MNITRPMVYITSRWGAFEDRLRRVAVRFCPEWVLCAVIRCVTEWAASDSRHRRHICQVSPERRRPDAAWLRAHEATLSAGLRTNNSTDDKGEYSESKATMTPLPTTTTTTTPMPPATPVPGGGSTAAPATTTPSPCSGENWWLLTSRCHHVRTDWVPLYPPPLCPGDCCLHVCTDWTPSPLLSSAVYR